MKAAEQKTVSNEVEKSVAFAALNGPSRRTFAVIAAAIERSGGEEVAVTTNELMAQLNTSSTSSVALSVRTLRALGFITVRPGHRSVGTYALAHGWADIVDPAEAERLAETAKTTEKRASPKRPTARALRGPRERAVKKVEPEPAEQEQRGPRPISLPVLPWPANPDAGLRPGDL